MTKLLHHKITQEQWNSFPQKTQLLNIASELSRIYHQGLIGSNPQETQRALERALELIDLTLQDPKWRDIREIYQLRDSLVSFYASRIEPAVVHFFYDWLVKTSENL